MKPVALYLSRAIQDLVAERERLRQEQARVDRAIDVMRQQLEYVQRSERN